MIRYICSFLLLFYFSHTLLAQEINARLTINTNQVQSVDAQMIEGMRSSVNNLLNEYKWTEANFQKNEKIDCIIAITISEMPTINTFKGDIQVTVRRPVYNSSYITTILNYRDTQFDFAYTMGESLDYNSYSLTSNLVATIAYYAYVLIGLDFDSFSLHGGRAYFTKAMNIATTMQTSDATGWKPFTGKTNRYDLAVALTEESSAIFHSIWYNYHIQGLDMMEANASRGRLRILETVDELEKLQQSRLSLPLLTLFGETKIDELIKICEQATAEEKKNTKAKLLKLFPTKSKEINELK